MHRFRVKEARPQRLYTTWFYWYKLQEQAEVIYGHTNWIVVAFGGRGSLAGLRQEETYGVIFHISILVIFNWACIYVNILWVVQSTFMHFTEGKLYPNKILLAGKCTFCYSDLWSNLREKINTEIKAEWEKLESG